MDTAEVDKYWLRINLPTTDTELLPRLLPIHAVARRFLACGLQYIKFHIIFKDQMHKFFGSEFFDFELTRLLGSASSGGCEPAEFLEAVSAIRKHDPESWHRAWSEQSRRAESIAREAVEHGQNAAARRAFLRSANYARASGYMLIGPDARILETAERSISLFREAIPYMDGKVIDLNIPHHYDLEDREVLLPGYLFLPPPSKRLPDGKTPILINCGGADSTKEELYFALPAAGVELGYAVITFDGPGQGITLKRDKIPLRPDFEAVVAEVLAAVDQLATAQPELGLDFSRVSIAGASMGAYYSLRACSSRYPSISDLEIRACVAIDGFYSLQDVAMERMPGWYSGLWLSGWIPDSVLNGSIQLGMASNFPMKWEMSLGMSIMGTGSPGKTLRRFRLFSLDAEATQNGGKAQRIVDGVRCPVLLTGASNAMYASVDDGTIAVYNALTGVTDHCKEVWTPSEPGNGGLTGKVGAWQLMAQKTFWFLDKHQGIYRS
ncbi:alpha/beta hydrolase [Xylariaceae sp. AK1471]|nr:alpha/beta hydrolase [Xylariaceae sp. AK1471]